MIIKEVVTKGLAKYGTNYIVCKYIASVIRKKKGIYEQATPAYKKARGDCR